MANILTAGEAAVVLRCDASDAAMLALLPQVDAYIKNATGRDWASDSSIRPEAKSAARMLLVLWHENPGMMIESGALSHGLRAALTQLEAISLQTKVFTGANGAVGCSLPGACVGDSVSVLVGLIGVSGDQKSLFETVISVDDQIQQLSTGDHSEHWFRVTLTPPEEL